MDGRILENTMKVVICFFSTLNIGGSLGFCIRNWHSEILEFVTYLLCSLKKNNQNINVKFFIIHSNWTVYGIVSTWTSCNTIFFLRSGSSRLYCTKVNILHRFHKFEYLRLCLTTHGPRSHSLFTPQRQVTHILRSLDDMSLHEYQLSWHDVWILKHFSRLKYNTQKIVFCVVLFCITHSNFTGIRF